MYAIFRVIIERNRKFSSKKIKEADFADSLEPSKRSIFQTFWKPDCCTKSLFFELETSNFGY